MTKPMLATTLSIAIAAGALVAGQAGAVTMQPVLEDADIAKVVDAAKDEMAARKVKGCVAIANPEGVIIYFERQQGAYTNCNQSAIDKAKAAAEFQSDTKTFMDLLNGKSLTHLLKVPGLSPLPGGVPLSVNKVVVVGVGISTPDGNIDIPVAEKAASSLKML